MKHLLVVLAFGLLPWGAAADPVHCKALAEASPAQLLGIDRSPTEHLETEQPGLGYAVRYRDAEISLSVYFFDGGHATLGEAEERGYFEGAIGDMHTAAQQGGFTYSDFRGFDARGAGTYVGYIADARDSRGLFQAVALGRSGDCLIKLRFTTALETDLAQRAFWALATGLGLER